ncbi:MAG TPA: PrsW family glutamic-type intramembrane protease [Casimicrobiaceae bacterium]|nr:PrsW family glutamic-type intramembrane protease [Casimicrobiaceae bacterium]
MPDLKPGHDELLQPMPHFQPISYSILIASLIPLLFLFLIKWLNFLETHRLRLVILALVWGAISTELSYLVSHPMALVLGKQFVGTHTAPIVEEIFKSLVLLYLVRRADTTFFVDGAVYGFASGIGFAIAENMLYLSRVDMDTGLIVGTTRAFVASVLHGSTTALVGIAVAGFPLGRVNHPLLAWVIGLIVAIAVHTAYNNIAFHQFVFAQTGLLVLAGIAFTALLLVAGAILWGLRRERNRLRKSLGMQAGVSKGEAMLVHSIDELDDLLAPVEERFGEVKREQVASVLFLGVQLAMKQELIRKTKDPELRAELASQITEAKRELKHLRHDVGMYVMSYVRSIMPKTTWSLWARLEQTLTKLEAPRTNLWNALGVKLAVHDSTGRGLHARIEAELDARMRTAALATEGEE